MVETKKARPWILRAFRRIFPKRSSQYPTLEKALEANAGLKLLIDKNYVLEHTIMIDTPYTELKGVGVYCPNLHPARKRVAPFVFVENAIRIKIKNLDFT